MPVRATKAIKSTSGSLTAYRGGDVVDAFEFNGELFHTEGAARAAECLEGSRTNISDFFDQILIDDLDLDKRIAICKVITDSLCNRFVFSGGDKTPLETLLKELKDASAFITRIKKDGQ